MTLCARWPPRNPQDQQGGRDNRKEAQFRLPRFLDRMPAAYDLKKAEQGTKVMKRIAKMVALEVA